jgi:hypothetical protein
MKHASGHRKGVVTSATLATLASIASFACTSVGSETSQRSDVAPPARLDGEASAEATVQIHLVIAEMPNERAIEVFGKRDWNGMTFREHEAPDLDAVARSHTDVEVVSRPKFVVRDGGSAELSTTDETRYVKDYTLDSAGSPQPVYETLKTGTWVDLAARLHSADRAVDLTYKLTRKTLEQPIPERTLTLPGTAQSVTVQLPVATGRTVNGHRELKSGETLALDMSAIPGGDASAGHTVALISVAF